MSSIIAARYARALINLAAGAKLVEPTGEDLQDVVALIEGSPELHSLLTESSAPPAVKDEALRQVLDKAKIPALVATFARLMLQKRRAGLLPEVLQVYRRLADERLGRAQAELTVAEALPKAEQEQLRKRLEAVSGKAITLQVTVDPSILGGAVTRIGSTVWDGSLRNQLHRIRESILKS